MVNEVMILNLCAGLLALASPAAAALTVEDLEVWRQAQALARPVSTEVDLNVMHLPGGYEVVGRDGTLLKGR